MNIVKFHGYWQDRTKNDDRPRVSEGFFGFGYIQCHFFTGGLHHGIYVQWIIKTLSTENEKIQTKSFEKFLASMVCSIIIRS